MAKFTASDLEEALELQATVNAPLFRNTKGGGHAFSRISFLVPSPCVVCNERVMLLASPCRCLLCGCAAHRACISRVAAQGATMPFPCGSGFEDREAQKNMASEEDENAAGIASTIDTVIDGSSPNHIFDGGEQFVLSQELESGDDNEDNENTLSYSESTAGVKESVSLLDNSLMTRQAQRASALVGATALGTIAGGFIGGACGIMAIGRVTIALSGATVAYRKARQEQLSGLIIPPPAEEIPLFWAEKALEVRKSRVWAHTHSRFTAADQEQQRQVDECLLEEKVSLNITHGLTYSVLTPVYFFPFFALYLPFIQVALFVGTLLHNINSLPGFMFSELLRAYRDRHPQSGATVQVEHNFSPIFDCQGVAHELVLCTFQYHPLLAQSDESVIETINAIDRTVHWEVYSNLISYFESECKEADESLRRNCAKTESFYNEAATRALFATASARSGTDKMYCVTRFVEAVSSESGRMDTSADDLLPALIHAIASVCHQMSLHAEILFIEKFCRNELMFTGKDGYALTSLKGAVMSATYGSDR